MVQGMLWFLAMCAFIIAGLAGFTGVASWVDIPSIAIVLGGSLLLLFASFSPADIGGAIGFQFRRNQEISRTKFVLLTQIYKALGNYSLFCGIWGTAIGFVLILQTMNDPDTLGPNCYVAFLTLFYGLIGAICSLLATSKLKLCPVSNETGDIKPAKQAIGFTVAAVLFIVMSIFAVQTAGSVISFLDITSLLIVAGGSVFGILFFTQGSGICNALKTAFTAKEITVEEAKKSIVVLARSGDIIVSMLILGEATGLIAMVCTITDPSTIGPDMVVTLLSTLYGIGLLMVVRSLYYAVQRKCAMMGEMVEGEAFFSAAAVTVFAVAMFVLPMVILFASM
ncbi:MAG: MotA/TolQ/ExbB proton channel family protein [Candidatus Glassbacteria bacterium]